MNVRKTFIGIVGAIVFVTAAYAATSKLSQIASAGANMASGDTIIGVTGGNTDVQFSRAQIAGGVATALSSRTVLTADQSFFVNASTGNDSNNCTGSGTPCLTIQGVVNLIATSYDIGGNKYHVTVNLADGTYAGNVFLPVYVGQDKGATWNTKVVAGIEIKGNTTTPANVVISVDTTAPNPALPQGDGIPATGLGAIGGTSVWSVRGVTFATTGGQGAAYLRTSNGGRLTFDKVTFGANASGAHAYSVAGGYIVDDATWTITGNARAAFWSDNGGHVDIGGAGTLTGTPAFSGGSITAFLVAFGGGAQIIWAPSSITGSATGIRFDIEVQGGLTLFSPATLAAIPGNTTGFWDCRSKLSSVGENLYYGSNPASSYTSSAMTVANLWPAAGVAPGCTVFVKDATSTTAGTTLAGGGSNKVLAVSDWTSTPVYKIIAGY